MYQSDNVTMMLQKMILVNCYIVFIGTLFIFYKK
jgi:hypothetical protein